jgi:hypothetical protein
MIFVYKFFLKAKNSVLLYMLKGNFKVRARDVSQWNSETGKKRNYSLVIV